MLSTFLNRKMAAILVLGFAAGVPLELAGGGTLQAWLKDAGVSIENIGLFSLVGLPYTVKYLWSPLMDRYFPPLFGKRRGWMALAQILLVGMMLSLTMLNPNEDVQIVAMVALIIAFLSASQDIAIDAYRTDVTEGVERGPAASLYIMGYRIAMIVTGAIALVIADQFGWRPAFFMIAIVMSIGVIGTVLAPEPAVEVASPKTLGSAVIHPFIEYFKRKGALEILAFIVLYKLADVIATALRTPFIMEMGFTKTDIGAVTKVFGLIATILGTLLGGGALVKLGIKKSLWIFGIAQGASNLAYAGLAALGHHYPMMVASIGIDNFCGGMGTAAYSAFMMSIIDKRFTATQYALLTSLMALTRVVASAPTGFLQAQVGWLTYFLVSTLFMIPGLLLLLRYEKWTRPSTETVAT